ncbi:hypothetical protein FQZ97_1075700 [compost metagenome]
MHRVGREHVRVRLGVGFPDDHGKGLQQQRHADGRDQRGQTRGIAQWPVGQLLDRVVERGADHHRDHRGKHQDQPQRHAGRGVAHDADDGPAGERAHHEHVTVREVDQSDDAVHHGVAQGNQRIHAAQNQTVDDLL